METNQRQSDELNWTVAGIRSERARIEERLKYLNEREQQLVGGGMTSAAATPTPKTKAKAKSRKRQLSPETREKMRAAARKRWNKPETTSAPAPLETVGATM
jgi:hypothetical protein